MRAYQFPLSRGPIRRNGEDEKIQRRTIAVDYFAVGLNLILHNDGFHCGGR